MSKVSTTYYVSMVAEFGDGSTRTITQDNPLDPEDGSELTDAINDFSTFVKTNNIILSKDGASFSRIKSASHFAKTIVDYEIGK